MGTKGTSRFAGYEDEPPPFNVEEMEHFAQEEAEEEHKSVTTSPSSHQNKREREGEGALANRNVLQPKRARVIASSQEEQRSFLAKQQSLNRETVVVDLEKEEEKNVDDDFHARKENLQQQQREGSQEVRRINIPQVAKASTKRLPSSFQPNKKDSQEGGRIGDDEAYKLLHSFGLLGARESPEQPTGKASGGKNSGNNIRLHSNSRKNETQDACNSPLLSGKRKNNVVSKPGPANGDSRASNKASTSRSSKSESTKAEIPEEGLSPEQSKAIEAVLTGRNVFITGGAGVGKSFLVKKMVEELKSKRFRRVQICASTGIAAVHIQGQTIHSFAGIPIDKESKESIAEKSYKQKRVRKRWQDIDVLVIDEISMVSSDLFDTLDYIAKRCRGTEVNGRALVHKSPMGGIQVIAVGDLFQLPPVDNAESFVFESSAWQKLDFCNVVLKHVWRQRDPTFINILNELRFGKVNDSTFQMLRQCNRPLSSIGDGILPTKLYPFRRAVDSENQRFFRKLEGQIRDYQCINFASSERAKPYLARLNDIGVPSVLETKPRMQVMLKTNLDIKNGLCNGSRGVILGYRPFEAWKKEMGDEGIKFRYPGSLTHLKKWGKDHPHLPYVLFANGMKVTIPPATWERKFLDGKAVVTRLQIPLLPAWALTIHKSQGMSLDRVHINLTNAFGSGMTYVALSRARHLQGLQVEGFSRDGVKTNAKVIKFYNEISSGSGDVEERNKGDNTEPNLKGAKSWSRHLEDHVYDVVKVNVQSALTQALGSGKFDFDAIVESFQEATRRACNDVIKECKAAMPSTSKAKKASERKLPPSISPKAAPTQSEAPKMSPFFQQPQEQQSNENKSLCDVLRKIGDALSNQPFRSRAYKRAAEALSRCPSKVQTLADAVKIDGIGNSIGIKIEEFAKTGKIALLGELTRGKEAELGHTQAFSGRSSGPLGGSGPGSSRTPNSTHSREKVADSRRNVHQESPNVINLESDSEDCTQDYNPVAVQATQAYMTPTQTQGGATQGQWVPTQQNAVSDSE